MNISSAKNILCSTITLLLLTLTSFILPKNIFAAEIFDGTWRAETNYPINLASQVNLTNGEFIYVIGGATSSPYSLVYYALPGQNGEIQNWLQTTPLPQNLFWHTGLVNDGYIYILGGSIIDGNGFSSTNKVLYAKIQSDGSLSSWAELNNLPVESSLGRAFVAQNKIYFLGGLKTQNGNPNIKISEIYSAQINQDGTIGNWDIAGIMPDISGSFGAYYNDGVISLFGSKFTETPDYTKTHYASLNSDGTVGTWNESESLGIYLQRPIYSYYDNTFIILGGLNVSGLGFINNIHTAQNLGGAFSNWFSEPLTLPNSNCCSDAPVINDRMYIIGGHDGSDYFNSVYSLKLKSLSKPNSLNLPFNYPNRLEEDNENDFKDSFSKRVTSVFDHNSDDYSFINYLGDDYRYRDCFLRRLNDHNLDCYDSHNGTDFSSRGGLEIFPAAEGVVEYATDSENCLNQGRGYGCNVIISHADVDGLENYYTIYGHLSKVLVSKGDAVSSADQIGVMGRTGRSTGVHLHFGMLHDLTQAQVGLEAFSAQAIVSEEIDWSLLIEDINNEKKLNYGFLKKWLRFRHKKHKHPYYKRGHDEREEEHQNEDDDNKNMGITGLSASRLTAELRPSLSACTYTASGHTFYFVDPSGWLGEGADPWQDSCGVENNNLWKYPLNN